MKTDLSRPLVSVVVPAYNAETFLERTLQSVRDQSYCHLEALVVDDGSRDRTPEIVQAVAQQDPRIKLLQQPNSGVAAARNLGIQHARGEFIAPIDADDLWHPHALEKMVALFKTSNPQVGVVYTWSMDVDEQAQSTGGFHAATVTGNVHKTLICHNFLGNASSTLIRKACLDQLGGYNPEFRGQNAQGCEDWDLYLRLAEHYDFAVVPEFLVGYRKVTGSMSGSFSQMARSQQLMLQVVRRKHPEIPKYLYRISRSSFYLYLAYQCDSVGNAKATLSWLWQAIRVDPITSLGRLGLYVLMTKSFVKLAIKKSWQLLGVAVLLFLRPILLIEGACQSSGDVTMAISPQPASNSPRLPDAKDFPTTLTKPHIYPLKVQLKVFVSTVIHLFLNLTIPKFNDS